MATGEAGAHGRWDPWVALAARPHVELRFAPEASLLGGAMLVQGRGRTVIVLDPALDRRRRRVALAHELVHEERGGGCDGFDRPEGWDAVAAREEREVVREVAARLVPRSALRSMARARVELDDPLAPWEVADAFDVDLPTALLALSGLAGDQAA